MLKKLLIALLLTIPAMAFSQTTSYLWSTGDTTASIFPVPMVTTTYYVTVTHSSVAYYDSITIVVNNPSFINATISACESYSWPVNGVNYTTSGMYIDTLTNTAGCDSVVTLNLTINNANTGTDIQTACDTYTWIDGVTYTASTSTPTFTLTNAAGCDSVVTLNLTISQNPLQVFAQDTILFCGADSVQIDAGLGFSTYDWSNGANTQNTFVFASGMYFVTATNSGGCETVDSIYVSLVNGEIEQNDTTICAGTTIPISLNNVGNNITAANIFDGDHYFQMQNSGPIGMTPRTFSFWINTSDTTAQSILNYGGTSNYHLDIGLNQDLWYGAGSGWCDQYTRGLSFFTGSHSSTFAQTYVDDGQWHHITYVLGTNGNYSYNNFKFYVDGIEVSTPSSPYCGHNWGGWTYNTGSAPMFVGKPNGNIYASNFSGMIDELGIWSKALSPSEVSDLYFSGITLNSDSLKHYYSFNTLLNDSILVDQIGGNHGILKGSSITPSYTTSYSSSSLAFTWSTGDTAAHINVTPTQTTTYFVTITDGVGSCTDSVTVTVNNSQVNLPQDTILSCGADSVQIDAGLGFSTYAWSNGGSTQTTYVSVSGMYHVTATNVSGCPAEDSVYVSSINAQIEQNDTIVCEGSSINLSATNPTIPVTICSESAEGQTLLISAPFGFVFNAITFASYGTPIGSCGNYSLSSCHAANSSNIVSSYILGNNSANIPASNGVFGDPCSGIVKKLIVEATYLANNLSYSYQWSTGDTTASVNVTPTQTTTYYVTITDGVGSCVDSVTVTINNANTGTDIQTACDTYTWIDGVTYTASTSSPTFTLTNAAGCDSVVTLNLTINNSVVTQLDTQAVGDFTWPLNGNSYTMSGTYYDTLSTLEGCDSIIELSLTINPLITVSAQTSDTLVCAGTTISIDIVLNSVLNNVANLAPGDIWEGGIVAYLFQPGDYGYVAGETHGIIAAPNDIPAKKTWGNSGGLALFSTLSNDVGKGQINSNRIAFVRDSLNGSYPALQATLEYSNWGKNDWFLPSHGDLIKMRENLALYGMGDFYLTLDPNTTPYWAQFGTGYWSSSLMTNGAGAQALFFSNGGTCGCAYFEDYWVRPVRYF